MKTTSTIRIAIADDHELIRKMLINLVSELGYQVVIAAANGADLIEQIENAAILPDLCIIDINMPVMNGYTATKTIVERWATIKVLSMSFGQIPNDLLRMVQAGAHGFVNKTDDPRELETAINEICFGAFYWNRWAQQTIMQHLRKEHY